MQGWGPGEQGRAREGAGGPAGGGAKPLPPQTALSGEPAAGDHVLLQGSPPTLTGPTPMPGLARCPIGGLAFFVRTMTIHSAAQVLQPDSVLDGCMCTLVFSPFYSCFSPDSHLQQGCAALIEACETFYTATLQKALTCSLCIVHSTCLGHLFVAMHQ